MTGAYPVLHLGPARSTRPKAEDPTGARPVSLPEARRFVGTPLACCPARETLMTCVSELCANAIAHTESGRGGVFTVEVDRPRDGVARVAVTDGGGASVPAAGSGDLMAEGGRGLAMVAACTSRWGSARPTRAAPSGPKPPGPSWCRHPTAPRRPPGGRGPSPRSTGPQAPPHNRRRRQPGAHHQSPTATAPTARPRPPGELHRSVKLNVTL